MPGSIFNLITWNINGFNSRKYQIKKLLKTYKPDFLCLQEIKTNKLNEFRRWLSKHDYHMYSSLQTGENGVCIITKHLTNNIYDPFLTSDNSARFMSLYFPQFHLIVACTYAPQGSLKITDIRKGYYNPLKSETYRQKLKFYYNLNKHLAHIRNKYPGSRLVLAGDFNAIMDIDLDTYFSYDEAIRRIPSTIPEIKALHYLVNQQNLIDIWRLSHPNTQYYSTFKGLRIKTLKANIVNRIDYVFVTPNFRKCYGDFLYDFWQSTTFPSQSDHVPLSVYFR